MLFYCFSCVRFCYGLSLSLFFPLSCLPLRQYCVLSICYISIYLHEGMWYMYIIIYFAYCGGCWVGHAHWRWWMMFSLWKLRVNVEKKNAPRIRVHVPLLSSTHTIHPSIYRTYIVFPCVMIMDGVRVSLTWCEIIAIYTRYYTSTALTEMSQCQCAYENSGQNRCVRFAWDGACVLPELYLTLASPIGANISPTKDTGTCCTFILYNIIIINSYTANISWTCRFCKAVKVTIEDIIWY